METYLSPVETHCMNIDYFIPDEENETRGFSEDAMARLREFIILYKKKKFRKKKPVFYIDYLFDFFFCTDMGRSMIALFMVGFLAIFSAFWTGVVGCWRRSPGNITATAILMLFACKKKSLLTTVTSLMRQF